MPAYCFRQRTAGSPALRYSQTLQAPRPDCRLHPDSRLFRSLFCQRLPHSPDRRRMPVRSNLRRCCTLRFDTLHSRCCDFGAPPSADFPFPVLQLLLRPIPRLFLQAHSDLYPSAHNRGHNPALHCLYRCRSHSAQTDSVPVTPDFASPSPIWRNLQYAALPPGFSDDCGTQKCPSLSSPPVPERPKLS